MSLQRDEQNGLKRLSADQVTGLPQVGQRTTFSLLMEGSAGCVTGAECYFNPSPDSLYSPRAIIGHVADLDYRNPRAPADHALSTAAIGP
jgi:hypothetical protein